MQDKVEEAPWLYPLVVDYKRRKLCTCNEKRYVIDFQNRLVFCKICGAVIDPFDALLAVAHDEERINGYLNSIRQESEKERSVYMKYKGVNDITRNHRNGMIPVCPFCQKPFLPEEIKTFVNKKYVKKGDQNG